MSAAGLVPSRRCPLCSLPLDPAPLLRPPRPPPPTRSATYCKIYEFPFTVAGRQADMVFTSVAGHLLELEFEGRVRGWHSCAPRELYDAQVFKGVPKVGG